MAGNPEYQNIDSYSVPDPVTPADSPSAPSQYASVVPSGQGTAPYNVQAPMEDLSAMTDAAVSLAGPGGPRQAMTQHLLDSPQGFSVGGGTSGWDITAGFSGDGGDGWPNDVQPLA